MMGQASSRSLSKCQGILYAAVAKMVQTANLTLGGVRRGERLKGGRQEPALLLSGKVQHT